MTRLDDWANPAPGFPPYLLPARTARSLDVTLAARHAEPAEPPTTTGPLPLDGLRIGYTPPPYFDTWRDWWIDNEAALGTGRFHGTLDAAHTWARTAYPFTRSTITLHR